MTEPIRIPPDEARKKILAREALFVCAYEDDEKFKRMHLEGAISFNEFAKRADSLSKDQEIIFYCAWPKEASAARRAVEYAGKGFTNITVLAGGVEGWKLSGYPLEQEP